MQPATAIPEHVHSGAASSAKPSSPHTRLQVAAADPSPNALALVSRTQDEESISSVTPLSTGRKARGFVPDDATNTRDAPSGWRYYGPLIVPTLKWVGIFSAGEWTLRAVLQRVRYGRCRVKQDARTSSYSVAGLYADGIYQPHED